MRDALVVLPASLVAFALLWVMQAMLGVEGELQEARPNYSIDFVRLERDTEVQTRRRELPRKEMEEEPPLPEISTAAVQPGSGLGEPLPIMSDSVELEDASQLANGASRDTDIVPLVRVEPLYPTRALQAGVSGWVEIRFTITAAGTVKNPRVFKYFPSRVFNRAALRAVRKWKYAPKVEDGRAVERPGVEVRLEFRLDRHGASNEG